MTSKFVVRLALILCVVTVFAATLSAQRAEIYPNAGFFWPDTMNNGQKFKSDGIYGMKGGVFLNQNVQLEGSFGYINHFELRQPASPTIFGVLYDVNGTYNFGERQFLNKRISPFLSVGAGGLTSEVRHGTSAIVRNVSQTTVLNDGDTFFTVNYGGGVKFLNLAGPMGFRVDVRGRTMPNYFGETTTWLEPTAGLTFSWGER
jgi:hypothetical protein